jgi:hypothetical protein
MSANRLGVKLLTSTKRCDEYLVSEYRAGGRKPFTRLVVVDKYGVHCKGCLSTQCAHKRAVERRRAAKVQS